MACIIIYSLLLLPVRPTCFFFFETCFHREVIALFQPLSVPMVTVYGYCYHICVLSSVAPMLQFQQMAYSVREPSRPDQTHYVAVTIVRTGDRNRTSQVRLSTRDGSAKSGVDYEPYSNVLIFDPGKLFCQTDHPNFFFSPRMS